MCTKAMIQQSTQLSVQNIPISLYIHFPWCTERCNYCDFNAHKKPNIIPETAYLKALTNQLYQINQKRLELNDSRQKLKSIFIGGGTPSLISPKIIAQVLKKVSEYFDIADIEITLEANPESVNDKKFKQLKSIGVNRISIGVQSFAENQLKLLSRIHSKNQAIEAIEIALKYFKRVNVDLMYGLIKQSEKQALADINQLLSYPIHHLSYYELTIEPNTHFYHFPPKLTSEKKVIKMQQNAIELMKLKGFERYEISAFSQKNQECLHNLNYWQFGDYLAIGAGASAKISYVANNKLEYFRYQAPKGPNQFIKWADNLTHSEGNKTKIDYKKVSEKDIIFEFFLNSSRLINGFNSDLLTKRTGIKISRVENQLKELIKQGLLERINDFTQACFLIKPTKRGLKYLNEIAQHFL